MTTIEEADKRSLLEIVVLESCISRRPAVNPDVLILEVNKLKYENMNYEKPKYKNTNYEKLKYENTNKLKLSYL